MPLERFGFIVTGPGLDLDWTRRSTGPSYAPRSFWR